MTRNEVLAQIREIQPGEYSDARLLQLVDECDQKIYRELLDGYLIRESQGELVAPPPYDKLYVWYALSQIYLMQQDIGGYNNAMMYFNAMWDEYGRMISRTYDREKPSRYNI